MDARVRKRHMSRVRSMGGYRVMCSWRPADVMYPLAVDQCVCFRRGRVSMLSLVLWAIPRGTMRAVGCGMWSGVRTGRPPFPLPLFPLFQYVGTYSECSGILAKPRNYLDGSTGRYRSAHPCTESSRGPLICRTRTGVCRSKARRRVPYRFFFSHWSPRNVSTLYCQAYFPAAVFTLGIYTTAVLLLAQSGGVGASRGTPFIPLLLPYLYWRSSWGRGPGCAWLDHTYGTWRDVPDILRG